MRDFTRVTLEELNTMTQEVVNALSEDEFLSYYSRSKEVGNNYIFFGITDSFNPPRFGKETLVVLEKGNGDVWRVRKGAGLMPKWLLKPLMVDEDTFSRDMKMLRVSDELLREFFEFKVDVQNLVDLE